MMRREQFILILEALPSAVPAVIRLRSALKTLRRSYGLRCVQITAENAAGLPSSRWQDGCPVSGGIHDPGTGPGSRKISEKARKSP